MLDGSGASCLLPVKRKKALSDISSKAVVTDSTNRKPVINFDDTINKHTATIADPVAKRKFRAQVVQLALDALQMHKHMLLFSVIGRSRSTVAIGT